MRPPTVNETTKMPITRTRVFEKDLKMTSLTGRLVIKEEPKSLVTRERMYFTYWSGSGSSRP